MSKTLASWVDKYGTGSGPGSPDGQPGWGGGSDRIQAALNKPFNARAAALSTDFGNVDRQIRSRVHLRPDAVCDIDYRIKAPIS